MLAHTLDHREGSSSRSSQHKTPRACFASLLVLVVLAGPTVARMRPHAQRGALPVDRDGREEGLGEECPGQSSQRFTDELRALAEPTWTALIEEPFTDALAAGTLANRTLVRYLTQDHKFVDAFSALLAAMLAAAPTLRDRAPGAKFLALITTEENSYFERAFAALGVDEAADAPDEPETKAFRDLMRRAQHTGKLHAMLAVLCVAEWSYLGWADRVAPNQRPDLPFYHREWIDLHTGPYFRSVVQYLRDLLDNLAPDLSDEAREETTQFFLATVQAERDFWAMVHRGSTNSEDGEESAK